MSCIDQLICSSVYVLLCLPISSRLPSRSVGRSVSVAAGRHRHQFLRRLISSLAVSVDIVIIIIIMDIFKVA